ncbi:MAG TPA: aldo/keto reductase [Acidimicrobiia bacterium]|nr:aldo/keto reductase [Acidimicrobiia bacterium]
MAENPNPTDARTWILGDDLPVRRLGFGAMRITGPGIWGEPPDHDEAVAVLRRAVELGVDLIDTADSYGPFVSEQLIAEALHPYPEHVVIATKGGLLRDGPGQWRPDGRPEHLRAACEGSLQRLRLEQIPLYQLHRPDPKVPLEDSIGALVALQREGKVRHIGVSNVDGRQLTAAMRITPIVSVQNRYNPTDRSANAVLERCEAEHLAFLPWAPLGAGGLGSDARIAALAARHGATVNQVAVAWLLARSPVILPIPGTGSVAHLEENLAAASLRLAPDEMDLSAA